MLYLIIEKEMSIVISLSKKIKTTYSHASLIPLYSYLYLWNFSPLCPPKNWALPFPPSIPLLANFVPVINLIIAEYTFVVMTSCSCSKCLGYWKALRQGNIIWYFCNIMYCWFSTEIIAQNSKYNYLFMSYIWDQWLLGLQISVCLHRQLHKLIL